VRARLGRDLPVRSIFEQPEIDRIARQIGAIQNAAAGLAPLLALRSAGKEASLFCIHPAAGLCWPLAGLAGRVGDHPIFGLQARGLDRPAPLPASIEEVVADCLRDVLSVQPSGPYHLIGWSFGGLVAQHLACALRERGESVALLAVLDTYPTQPVLTDAEASEAMFLRYCAEALGLPMPSDPDALTSDGLVELARAHGQGLAGLDADCLRRMLAVWRNNAALAARAAYRRFDGDMLLFVAEDRQGEPGPAPTAAMWRPYVAGRIQVCGVAARHHMMCQTRPLGQIASAIAGYIHPPSY